MTTSRPRTDSGRKVWALTFLAVGTGACAGSSSGSGTADARAAADAAPVATIDGAGGTPGRDAPVSVSDGGVVAVVVGATTPFVSYEAEDGTLGGGATVHALTTPPTSRYSSPEVESSGHAYVALTATGDFVEWENRTGHPITAFNARASIPDAPGGGGITATLDVYVNGQFRQTLTLSSKQTWLYESDSDYNGNTQTPGGNPRVFFDDVHAFLAGAPLSPSDRIRLQKGSANDAAFYHVDVIDLEAPPPPAAQPTGSLSIADYGARANDPSFDNTGAIQSCIDDAQTKLKVAWIPAGTFYVRTLGGINARGITIVGAGAWYSTIYRNVPLPNATPLGAIFNVDSCQVRNFALDSNATSRASRDGAGGAMDTSGTGWSADGIWTQHTLSGFWASGTNGIVQNCRLQSIWADGCNLNNVSLNHFVGTRLTARNNFVRGTGDDAIAINSVDTNDGGATRYPPMTEVTIENNTSIAPWGGKGVAIYGGSGHVVRDNYMSDTARYIGLGVGKFGTNGSDLTSATVTGNVVERCGGNAYDQKQPALHVGNGGDGQGVGTVANAQVTHNTVRASLYNAVGFSTSSGIVFDDNTIVTPGLDGVVISPPFYPAPTGSASFSGNVVTGLTSGHMGFRKLSGGYTATQSGNSW